MSDTSDISNRVVGLRDLNRRTKDVIAAVEAGEPVLITRGRDREPVAALVPVDRRRAEDLMVGFTRERMRATKEADEQAERGETHSFADVLASMEPPADAYPPDHLESGPADSAVCTAPLSDRLAEPRAERFLEDEASVWQAWFHRVVAAAADEVIDRLGGSVKRDAFSRRAMAAAEEEAVADLSGESAERIESPRRSFVSDVHRAISEE